MFPKYRPRQGLLILLILNFLFLFTPILKAEVPRIISYQGILLDTNNSPQTGPVNLIIRFYDSAISGSLIFEEEHRNVELTDGIYSIQIGLGTVVGTNTPTGGIQNSIVSQNQLWLGVEVNGNGELSPRTSVSSVIFALKSEFAEKLSRPGSSEFDVSIDPSGNIGIGKANPASKLDVNGTVSATQFNGDGNGLTNISTNSISDGAVTLAKIASAAVISDAIVDGTIVNADISTSAAISGIKISPVFDSQAVVTAGRISIGSLDEGNFLMNAGGVSPLSFEWNPSLNNINAMARFKTTGTSSSATALSFENKDANRFIIGLTTNEEFAISYNSNISQPSDLLRITSSGNVGIGVRSPNQKLEVAGTAELGVLRLGDTGGNNIFWDIQEEANNDLTIKYGPEFVRITRSGKVGIGKIPDPAHELDVAGDVNVSGSFLTNGADYAEYFLAEETLNPGDLVGLNPNTGLARMYHEGDRLLGLVSEDPGVIGNAGVDKHPSVLVAIMGQVSFNKPQVIIEEDRVKTIDGNLIGYLLANDKCYINISSNSESVFLRKKVKSLQVKVANLKVKNESLASRVSRLEQIITQRTLENSHE